MTRYKTLTVTYDGKILSFYYYYYYKFFFLEALIYYNFEVEVEDQFVTEYVRFYYLIILNVSAFIIILIIQQLVFNKCSVF